MTYMSDTNFITIAKVFFEKKNAPKCKKNQLSHYVIYQSKGEILSSLKI